jgi:predicted RNase H-like HicB family nuclease
MPKVKATKAKRTGTIRSAQYEYTVLFEPAEEGGFIVKVPALNGIATQGETLDDARAMAEDLIRGYLQSLRKHGEPIPVEHERTMTTRIAVSLARA